MYPGLDSSKELLKSGNCGGSKGDGLSICGTVLKDGSFSGENCGGGGMELSEGLLRSCGRLF